MTLTWNGHACFTFDTDEGVVVFDPYQRDYVPGLRLPELAGDTVLCSHGHEDHCWPEGVLQTRRLPGYSVETVATFHDGEGGSLRGENTVHIVDVNGFRLAHLGDLGHVLTDAQVQAMRHIDVLLVPMGGFYTIDAAEAKQVCDLLQPRIIVPMHYRKGNMGFDLIAEPEAFLNLYESVTVVDGHTLELTDEVSGVVFFGVPRQ